MFSSPSQPPKPPRPIGVLKPALVTDRRVVSAAPLRPFTIHVSDAALADLKARLANARFPDALQGDGWTHGTDLRYLKALVAYWHDRFDWREQERTLNRLEQFTTTIDGLTVHFIH